MNVMISPCILVCSIDPATGQCAGCGRTLDEIAGWAGYTDVERRRVMELLPARLQAGLDPHQEKERNDA